MPDVTFYSTLTGPRRRMWDRVGTTTAMALGLVLVCVSLVAVTAALLMSLIFVADAVTSSEDPWGLLPAVPDPVRANSWWVWPSFGVAVISQVLAAVLLFVVPKRRTVLFLRRFRHTDAARAVTAAAVRSNGCWRYVTLDDAAMAPTGLPTGIRAVGITLAFPLMLIPGLVRPLIKFLFWGALAGVAVTVAIGSGPTAASWVNNLQRISVVVLGVVAVLYLLQKVARVLFFFTPLNLEFLAEQMTNDTLWTKVRSLEHLLNVRISIASNQEDLFAPRLRSVEVDLEIWRTAVSALATVCTAPIIDVSEPTDAVLWEIAEMSDRFGSRCVFIGESARVSALQVASDPVAVRLRELLADRSVLAYTSDERGLARFSRALPATLEQRARLPLPAEQSDPLAELAAARRERRRSSPTPEVVQSEELTVDPTDSAVFVSHSHDPADAADVTRVVEYLTCSGVPVWYEPEPASAGQWERQVRGRIDASAALIVLVSEAAAESASVRRDVQRARTTGLAVHPLLLSDTAPVSWDEGRLGPLSDAVPLSAGLAARLREAAATYRPVTPARLVGTGFPPRNPYFAGREVELRAVASGLRGPSSDVVSCWIRGPAGAGKTQLAAEYCHRYRKEYEVIGWIDAGNPETIAGQLAQLAPSLGIRVSEETPAEVAAAAVREALSETKLRWLVVLDNVPSMEAVAGSLPAGEAGRLLVTSEADGHEHAAQVVDVDVLPRAQSTALLLAQAPGLDNSIADEICETLGDLPLAVEQAGAYLSESGLPCSRYLTLLRNSTAELSARGHVAGHCLSVAAVWELSRAHIRSTAARGRATVNLLEVCTFLGPEPITPSLFAPDSEKLQLPLASIVPDAVRFSSAVDTLLRYRLVKGGHGRGNMRIHELVASVVRSRVMEPVHKAPKQLRTAVGALAAVDPGQQMVAGELYTHPSRWPVWARLVPHIKAALAHLPQPHNSVAAMQLAERAGDYLLAQEQFASAVAYREWVVINRRRKHGDTAYQTREACQKLANAYAREGKAPAAPRLTDQALAHRRELLGEYLDVLVSRHLRGREHDREGRADEAIELLEQVLAVRTRVLGDEDLDTLVTGNDLACAYESAGRFEEAIETHQRVLATRHRTLGSEHPKTLLTLNNLAFALARAERLDEAIDTQGRVLAASWRVLGNEHPDTLTTLNNLAYAYHEAGHHGEAVVLFARAMEGRQRVLGEDHPDTVAARDNLARARQARPVTLEGDNVISDVGHPGYAAPPDEAIAAYRRLATAVPEVFESDLAAALHDRAVVLASAGEMRHARPFAAEAVAVLGRLAATLPEVYAERHEVAKRTLSRLTPPAVDNVSPSEPGRSE